MIVLLLDTEHELSPGSVVGDLFEVVDVLLVLPHGVHLLEHLLGPADQGVRRLVVVPQAGRQTLGVAQKLLNGQRHHYH